MQFLETRYKLTIPEIKEINRNITVNEAKSRRAKKEMIEANLRLVISIAKKIYQPWFTIFGSLFKKAILV